MCTYPETVVIHHSRKGAWRFAILVVAMIAATLAMFWYLSHETSDTIPTLFYVSFSAIYLIGLYVAVCLLIDAGKVALTIGQEGIKFDRYHLISWRDVEKVYIVENEGSDSLWLSVKEGVAFLPSGPRPLIWLATVSGLHRSIDITGYGSLSMKDEYIRLLIEKWLQSLNATDSR